MKQSLYTIVCAALAICGCGGQWATPPSVAGRTGSPKHVAAPGADTVYTEAKVMSMYQTSPDRALVLTDSAVIVGNLTWERGEYIKAAIQFGDLGNSTLARRVCLDLTECVQTRWNAPDDIATLEGIYNLLVNIEAASGNYSDVIRYATEASRLAHDINRPEEIGAMEAHIAHALSITGDTDEGIGRLRTVIDELWQTKTLNGVRATHFTTMKMLHILLEHEHYAEMASVCKEGLERIDEFERHPESFDQMPDGYDPAEFIDYARGQTFAFLTTAYARQYKASGEPFTEVTPAMRAESLRKALVAENEVFKTKWSRNQSSDCDRLMLNAYHYLDQFERFDSAIARVESFISDTISVDYTVALSLRAEAARMRGRLAEAISYLTRHAVIRDSLDNRQQHEQMAELATLYHLQEEQLSRQKAEAEAERSHIVSIALAVGLIAAIAFLLWFFRQKRIMEQKNRVLAREISEAIKYKEESEKLRVDSEETAAPAADTLETNTSLPTIHSSLSDADLYASLRKVILRDQLFLDPQLDRQALVDRFGLSKDRIGAAFAKGSPYKSLIDFLTDCRLPYAAKMLTEHPDLTIAEVAVKSGFTSLNTFGRNFKQKYALTPTQFREQ